MSSLKEQRRRARKAPPRRQAWNKGLRMDLCMDCDGCGWDEGGAALQTGCEKCKGRGKVFVR